MLAPDDTSRLDFSQKHILTPNREPRLAELRSGAAAIDVEVLSLSLEEIFVALVDGKGGVS